MKHLTHKGYTGSIEYNHDDNLLYGKVVGVQGLISYEGVTGQELERDFQEAIDAYLEDCKAADKKPEKPFKGSFNVRVPAALHQKAALLAMEAKMSLNNFVAESLRSRVMKEG
jgi:predicted HicB family RNase H-like nuclease